MAFFCQCVVSFTWWPFYIIVNCHGWCSGWKSETGCTSLFSAGVLREGGITDRWGSDPAVLLDFYGYLLSVVHVILQGRVLRRWWKIVPLTHLIKYVALKAQSCRWWKIVPLTHLIKYVALKAQSCIEITERKSVLLPYVIYFLIWTPE